MTVVDDTRAVYVPSRAGHVAGRLDLPPAGGPLRQPVLLCPPWGWAEVASYRARWDWARRLAAAGHPTLRIDLVGTGNSAGGPRDGGLVAAWIDSIAVSATWLCDLAGADDVAVIGLGLSGLLAAQAVRDGAPISSLVLWGTHTDGRRFIREQRAFALLSGVPPADPPDEIGGLHAGGFLLSDETMHDLVALHHRDVRGRSLRRVLVLDRDAHTRDEFPGAEVTPADDDGSWASMTDHPERSTLPGAVAATVERWLACGTPAARASGLRPADPREHRPVPGVRERAILLPGGGRGATGTLSAPATGPSTGPTLVLLNAGAVRQTGPNRLWTEAARRLAARGSTVVRVDADGIGDADAGGAAPWEADAFYAPAVEARARAILGALETAGLDPRFVVGGLCSGAWAAFHLAGDPRVTGAIMLNPGAFVYDRGAQTRRDLRHMRRALDPAVWGRAARGELDGGRVAAAARALVRAPRDTRRRPPPDRLEALLAPLADGRTTVTIGFSSGEPLEAEITRDGTRARLEATPGVRFQRLPGHDHTLRSTAAQAAALRVFDRASRGR